MISRFSVTNFRCLKSVSVPLTPIHVIIGENDSGKTSFLHAIKWLADISGGINGNDPKNALDKELNFEADAPNIQFSCETRELEACYEIQIEVAKTWQVVNERIRGHGHTLELVTANLEVACLQRHNDSSDDIPQRKLLAAVRRSLRQAQLLKPRPYVMKLAATLDGISPSGMDEEGFGLPLLLDRISNSDPTAFAKIIRLFCEQFPHFRRIRLDTVTGHSRQNGSILQKGWGKGILFDLANGEAVDAGQVSDGVMLYLAFLCIANQPNPPSLLLIEEPECGIYPKLLRDVIELMRNYVRDQPTSPQVVLTTHSPYILDLFQPEEVTFFSRARENASWVTARPLRDAPNITERLAGGEFHLGELWFNLSEEEIFGDATPAA